MTYNTILAEQDGAAMIITINRPEKRNAISTEVMSELCSVVKSVEHDLSVRGIILTGGTEYFSAGADLNEALSDMSSVPTGLAYLGSWRKLNETLENSSKPVLAAIEGFCLTGGSELALACDLRVAAEGAWFSITSSRIGTVAGAGGTQRLPRLVGKAKALELLFSADRVDAEEAYRIGLINRLVPQGEALETAKELVRVYEKRAPMSLALVKRVVHKGLQMDLASAIDYETMVVTSIYRTHDKDEGINSFFEKREPEFKGE